MHVVAQTQVCQATMQGFEIRATQQISDASGPATVNSIRSILFSSTMRTLDGFCPFASMRMRGVSPDECCVQVCCSACIVFFYM